MNYYNPTYWVFWDIPKRMLKIKLKTLQVCMKLNYQMMEAVL